MKQSDQEARQAFREQCRRQMDRPLALRIKYGFNHVYKPVLDDAPWRVFRTMADYRAWCEANLREYLGFKRATGRTKDQIEIPLLESFRAEWDKKHRVKLKSAADVTTRRTRSRK